MMSRLKRVGIAVVLAGCLWPGVGNAVWELLDPFYRGQTPGPVPLLQEWGAPQGGEWVLPAKVRTMLALLRENHVQEFRYSQTIERDPDESVVQRLAEGAYPIRIMKRARHLLLLSQESLPVGCGVIATRQEVVLADCS